MTGRRGRATDTARTMWDVTIADPVREGRLRLDGLPPVARQLAVTGVVLLGGLLASLVLNDLWRRGPLTLVRDFEQSPNLAGRGVIPFTLVALGVAWTLILAGGALGRPRVAALAGGAFLLANSGLTSASVLGGTRLLRLLPHVVVACYFAAPALAVAVSLLRRTARFAAARVLAGVALAVTVLSFFGAQLVVYVHEESVGHSASLPRLLDGTLDGLQGFLVPLFILAVAGLVQLNHRVAAGLATPFWDVPAWMARTLVLLLIALKLRYALVGRVGHWTTYAVERRAQAVQAVGFVLLLGGAAWLFRRARRAGPSGEPPAAALPTEPLLYGGSLLLSTPVLLVGAATSLSLFLVSRGRLRAGRWVQRNFPTGFVVKYLLIVAFTAVLLAGLALLARRRSPSSGLGPAAVVLLSAWALPNLVLQQLTVRGVGFDIGAVDLLLTLAALAYLVLRWRRLDTAAAVRLGALLLFATFVAGNNYVATRLVSRALATFTPPAVLLIVVGVLWVLLADSAFASVSSTSFPRETRALLWIGYLLFTVTVTNYVLVARETEFRIEFDRFAFHLLALPLAAWLAVRGTFAAPAPEPERAPWQTARRS